jgi:hypothetical protein
VVLEESILNHPERVNLVIEAVRSAPKTALLMDKIGKLFEHGPF